MKMPEPSQLRTITLSPELIIPARRYKVKMPRPSQLPEIPPWKSMKDVLRKAGHRQEARQKAKGGGKTKGTVVVMRGLPGSGKSTFVSRVFGPCAKVIHRSLSTLNLSTLNLSTRTVYPQLKYQNRVPSTFEPGPKTPNLMPCDAGVQR